MFCSIDLILICRLLLTKMETKEDPIDKHSLLERRPGNKSSFWIVKEIYFILYCTVKSSDYVPVLGS
jgi:hypothetical protein